MAHALRPRGVNMKLILFLLAFLFLTAPALADATASPSVSSLPSQRRNPALILGASTLPERHTDPAPAPVLWPSSAKLTLVASRMTSASCRSTTGGSNTFVSALK